MTTLSCRGFGESQPPGCNLSWRLPLGKAKARIRLVTAQAVAGGAALWAREAPRSAIKAVAERDIIPEIGMREAHAEARHVFTAFRDRWKVWASIFGNGRPKLALIGLDALMVPHAVVREARAGIEKTCGIPGRAVMTAASHSQGSGPVDIVMPGQFDGAPAEIQQLAYQESSLAEPNYLRVVVGEIIEAARLAHANRRTALVGLGFSGGSLRRCEARAQFGSLRETRSGILAAAGLRAPGGRGGEGFAQHAARRRACGGFAPAHLENQPAGARTGTREEGRCDPWVGQVGARQPGLHLRARNGPGRSRRCDRTRSRCRGAGNSSGRWGFHEQSG